MVVVKSGSLLAWVHMKSEEGKLPLYASTKKPILTVDLTTGEIKTRGLVGSVMATGLIRKNLALISSSIADNPIANRRMTFSLVRPCFSSSSEYDSAEVNLSYVRIATHNRVIALGVGGEENNVMVEVRHDGKVVAVDIQKQGRIRQMVANTYYDIIGHGVSQGELVDAIEEVDLI